MRKLILLLAFALNGCLPTDAQYSLPNGYRLDETSNIEMIISNPRNSGVFYGNITRINVRGNIVFGRVDTLPPDLQHLGSQGAPSGYFILDTESGSFKLGLGKQSWLNALRQNGIPDEPVLLRPPIFGINNFLSK